MTAKYDKVIVIEDEDKELKAIVIFNEIKRAPVFWGLQKFGMDDILQLLGTRPPVEE